MRIGTRGSALALAQAEQVAAALGGAEVVPVRTEDGEPGDKARFVRGVERALLEGEVDLAVHSAKDLPGERPEGVALVGVPGREVAVDALIGAAASMDDLSEGARVGTSSLRRRAQLKALRPDLDVAELRGNVDTRLRKLTDGDYDCVVLAAAGLVRLGREAEISFRFTPEEMTPAPGQGCLAIEARAGDAESSTAAGRITDRSALVALTAERAATVALGASCHTPIGVWARFDGDRLVIDGFAGLPDGSEWIRDTISGDPEQPAAVGEALAERMLAAGAREILDEVDP